MTIYRLYTVVNRHAVTASAPNKITTCPVQMSTHLSIWPDIIQILPDMPKTMQAYLQKIILHALLPLALLSWVGRIPSIAEQWFDT